MSKRIIEKKALSKKQQKAAERLSRIWRLKKRKLGLRQVDVATACGWANQSCFAAFLLGRTALNIESVLRIAKVLQVHPAEIMPEIVELLPETREPQNPMNTNDIEYLQTAKENAH